MPKLKQWLAHWWTGRYIPPEPLDPDDHPGVVVVNVGHHRRHWTARLASRLFAFIRQDWRWLIDVGLTAAGIVVALWAAWLTLR
jgi:hypothetical protein